MSVKNGIKKFFGVILLLIGLIFSLIGIIWIMKEENKATGIAVLVVGVVLFVFGVLLPKYKNEKIKIVLICCLVGSIVLAAFFGSIIKTDEEKRQIELATADDWKEEDNHIMAHIIMQQYVKEQLKSPSTAKFPTLDYKYQVRPDNVYYIESYVDSQNSFGATVRTQFAGVIQQVGKDDWNLIDLALE